jgi:PhoH-like ATPase
MAKSTKIDRKIFVLDTSVLLFDHASVLQFQEHDVVIPITVLEELDQFKKGNTTLNFEARSFIRYLDEFAGKGDLKAWTPLGGSEKGSLRVVMDEGVALDGELSESKADNRILAVTRKVQAEHAGRMVVLVTKDINLRIKARSIGILAEDYLTGKIRDVENLVTGWTEISDVKDKVLDSLAQSGCIPLKSLGLNTARANHYFLLKSAKKSLLAWYNPISGLVERIDKQIACGIQPRNAEQTFAMHALTNPNVHLVSLMGVAGTGKTLLALASAIEMKSDYHQIFLARPVVPLSNRDIGFLPGDIKSKMTPYMEPLWDNFKLIQRQFAGSSKELKKLNEMVAQEKLVIQPLAYIRGRSLSKVFFIVDEAQNLTPHEVKTIITRAGEGTKIVFAGDIKQIDTPYLDAQSNGLSYLMDKIQDHPLVAHLALSKGVRSVLANLGNDYL